MIRPISFSAPMVRTLLDGTKTQTRRTFAGLRGRYCARITQFGPSNTSGYDWHFRDIGRRWHDLRHAQLLPRLKYQVGDRLWVGESYYQRGHWETVEGKRTKGGRQKWAFVPQDDAILFEAPAGETIRLGRHHKDPATVAWHKRLGRFMPRKYSRLTLIITDVRVEPLQAISEDDAKAEGVKPDCADGCCWRNPADDLKQTYFGPVAAYSALWDSINGAGAWDANPWVTAYTFTVERRNIDQAAP